MGLPVVIVPSGGMLVTEALGGTSVEYSADSGLPVTIGLGGLPIEFPGGALSAARLLSYADANGGIAGSVPTNTLKIIDPITPANNYEGPLYNPVTFALNTLLFARADAVTCATRKRNGIIETVAANVPRISDESYGRVLLMEGAQTNLHKFSTDLSNAAWNKVGAGVGSAPVCTANFAVSPSGNSDATRVVVTLNGGGAVGDQSIVSQAPGSVITTVHAQSVWVKANGAGEVGKIIVIRGAAASTYTQVTLTSAWQRVKTIETSVAANANFEIGLRGTVGSSNSADFLVWNPQSEVGSWPSSDITTGATAVTRAAETCSLANTLFNLTQSAGTLYVRNSWDGGTAVNPAARVAMQIDNTTAANRHLIYNASNTSGRTTTLNALEALIAAGPVGADGVFVSSAYAYAANDCAFASRGILGTPDTLVNLPATTQMTLGPSVNGGISEFAFFGSRISNANLQALTT